MGASTWLRVGLVFTLVACGGEEFAGKESSGTGGSAGATSGGGGSNSGGGGAPSGGGGSTAGGGSPSGGGAPGGTAGAGGEAGVAGAGGQSAVCGQKPGAPTLLYTTLDDSNAIANPVVGSGAATSVGNFEPGVCSGAFRVGTSNEFVRYPAAGNINLTTGTADFHFKPAFAANDGQHHHLLSVPGRFQITRDQQGNLIVGIGSNVALVVPAANVPFVQNQWVRVTVVWKFQATGETAWAYFDAVGVGGTATPGPFPVPGISDDGLFIGATGEGDLAAANGVFDDFKIYDGTEEPF